MEHIDPLLDCLVELTRLYARPATRSSLSAGLPISKTGLTPAQFYRAADRAGFASRIAKIEIEAIKPGLLPCILLLRDNHACLLLKLDKAKKTATVLYPESGQGEVSISLKELNQEYAQRAIFSRPRFRLDQRAPGRRCQEPTLVLERISRANAALQRCHCGGFVGEFICLGGAILFHECV